MRTIISTDELAASTLPLSYELGNLYRGTHSSQFGTLRSLLLKDCPLLHFTLMFGDDVRGGTEPRPRPTRCSLARGLFPGFHLSRFHSVRFRGSWAAVLAPAIAGLVIWRCPAFRPLPSHFFRTVFELSPELLYGVPLMHGKSPGTCCELSPRPCVHNLLFHR